MVCFFREFGEEYYQIDRLYFIINIFLTVRDTEAFRGLY